MLHGLLGISVLYTYSLGEEQHFIGAVLKILAMHPDVRVLVQSVDC